MRSVVKERRTSRPEEKGRTLHGKVCLISSAVIAFEDVRSRRKGSK